MRLHVVRGGRRLLAVDSHAVAPKRKRIDEWLLWLLREALRARSLILVSLGAAVVGEGGISVVQVQTVDLARRFVSLAMA